MATIYRLQSAAANCCSAHRRLASSLVAGTSVIARCGLREARPLRRRGNEGRTGNHVGGPPQHSARPWCISGPEPPDYCSYRGQTRASSAEPAAVPRISSTATGCAAWPEHPSAEAEQPPAQQRTAVQLYSAVYSCTYICKFRYQVLEYPSGYLRYG
eukprot:SAG31_NODE_8223_length_1494_cov_1.148387_2_plen_157_part_00